MLVLVDFFSMVLISVNYTNPGPMLFGAWSPQKVMQVWNYTRVSKWRSFPFWANYPFKVFYACALYIRFYYVDM